MNQNNNERGVARIQEIIEREHAALYRPMPWRHIDDPYAIFISEVMLQQTQVARVREKYPQFMRRFPTVQALANTSAAVVVSAWQGLGYNRRALFVLQAAKHIVSAHGGQIPRSHRELCALPGIGVATAGAIQVYAHNIPAVFIETNIRRVFIFYCFDGAAPVGDEMIEPLIRESMPAENCRWWYYTLTDLGATLAKRVGHNPNVRARNYTRQPAFAGSSRQLRGALLRRLSAAGTLPISELPQQLNRDEQEVAAALQALEREGFVVGERGVVYFKP